MPAQLDDMCDQLVRNLKRLGALDHGLTEQADFDKTAGVPQWSMDRLQLNFKVRFDEMEVEFPIQWRNNPRLLAAEFFGTYTFLAECIRLDPGKKLHLKLRNYGQMTKKLKIVTLQSYNNKLPHNIAWVRNNKKLVKALGQKIIN